ncbi:BnaC02g29460D [Brassica napus]|uniref:BnaC02g29460D protein n=1 Tax=Brassica napus TaxID=3708 RepID=A0A078GFM6_BRANA|nr:BnaC02g29460D [Brassica napus]
MSGSKCEEALAEYKRALEVMSAKKAAPKRASPSETEDEVQFVRSSKRKVTAPASSSKKKKKPKASGSTPKVSPSSSGDPATVLANLNTKVFPLTPVSLPEDSLAAIQSVQSDLLQAMSRMFHLGERMDNHASLQADIAALTSQLLWEKDSVLAKEKEIKALRLKVRNQDEAGVLAASANISLREQLERRGEGACDLRCATETFDVEKSMAVSGAIVVTHWELMTEWFNHQTDS